MKPKKLLGGIVALGLVAALTVGTVMDKRTVQQIPKSNVKLEERFELKKDIQIQSYADLRTIFNPQDILDLKEAGVTTKHINHEANIRDEEGNVISRNKLFMLCMLNLTKEEILGFKNTEKPNALITYPTGDWNRAFATKESIQLFKKIKENYDVKVVVVEKEQEVYKAIDSIPNIELLVLSGHGSYLTLSLGEEDLRLTKAKKTEEYTIGVFDNELARYLAKLNSSAKILLLSCSNANGGEIAMNLANFVIKNSSGQQEVIASTKPFAASDITVNSIYPFAITIKYGKYGKDIMYSHTKSSLEGKFIPKFIPLEIQNLNKKLHQKIY